jgi:hypothetical protein
MPSINEILRANTHKAFAGLRTIKDEDSSTDQQFVLVEGGPDTFRFLGQLFTAMANSTEDCSLTIHPTGAGSTHFIEGSDIGVMLHRNDCTHGSKR